MIWWGRGEEWRVLWGRYSEVWKERTSDVVHVTRAITPVFGLPSSNRCCCLLTNLVKCWTINITAQTEKRSEIKIMRWNIYHTIHHCMHHFQKKNAVCKSTFTSSPLSQPLHHYPSSSTSSRVLVESILRFAVILLSVISFSYFGKLSYLVQLILSSSIVLFQLTQLSLSIVITLSLCWNSSWASQIKKETHIQLKQTAKEKTLK